MPAKPNELRITRIYDAPVSLVWEMWTDLKHVEKWWGPRGFTITTKSKDFRPGGKWIYTMHGPDGTDYPNITTYHEIIKHEKLVYDHGGNEDRPKLFSVTVLFKEEKGKTVMTMTMSLSSEEEAKATKKFIKQANGNSTWDRLAEYVEKNVGDKDVFIINRSIKADIESIFEMWRDPVNIVKWMGPEGGRMSFIKTDIREGGESLWSMAMDDGRSYYGKFQYLQLKPPHLICYSQNICDSEGHVAKLPFADEYPERTLNTISLDQEEGGETRITVRYEILGEATESERKNFNDMKSGMMVAWTSTFDKLEAELGVKSE